MASSKAAYHSAGDARAVTQTGVGSVFGTYVQMDRFTYTFENFFHPFVGDLVRRLNRARPGTEIRDMLDPTFLQSLAQPFFAGEYDVLGGGDPAGSAVTVNHSDKEIDVGLGGPYANYNWELLYHIPISIAVHLSSNQRFAEAQKWFHYVFDPTDNDTSVPTPQRWWRFLAFRNGGPTQDIDALLELLSTPDNMLSAQQLQTKSAVLKGYHAMLQRPFQPHVVARTRAAAYQWYVVMKYLDNLIAWGDSLFLQDTIETVNEATLCYVLAANLLGPRPQALPPRGVASPKNFLQLKKAGLDPMGNALVALEGAFPFNLSSGPVNTSGSGGDDASGSLFGIGHALYFCIPQNKALLRYWDAVADRLFKIRNSENMQGVVRQLPLFDPPLDPGMLVKAAAAGIDIGSIVSGLNQPRGPMRAPLLIQKSLELAAEVRALGGALLAAIEKGDAERMAVLRQGHELALHQMQQNIRFLQWQHAKESTNTLLKTRALALERYTYYLRLLGMAPDANSAPQTLALERRELTEDNFQDTYDALIGQYDKPVPLQAYSRAELAQGSSPSNQSGASGAGALFLNKQEDSELNTHLPLARDLRLAANISNTVASVLTFIPEFNIDLHFWGLGGSSKVFGGSKLSDAVKIAAEVLSTVASHAQDQAGIAARNASYQRRADDWTLQANLAARELMQIGRQIVGSLIAEQIAHHEYQTAKEQIAQAEEVLAFLQSKFTSVEFYGWMQSEISSLYYQYYRFACDIARKAEQTMKHELMRPELDQVSFIQFNYWDTGHRGLLSGEALHLDIKRMELAYHDSNKRELELTRHVSLRQLDPLALLTLRITGSCIVDIPEWLYDRDAPGLYMRRIKTIAVSLPSVTGPYTSVNCTLTLQRSSVRVSPLLDNGVYARDDKGEDSRFVDYFGAADVVVTSSGTNDSGMFEENLRDDRFLPFEGAGAVGTWSLALPAELRSFDYMTISDVIIHVRYTAREAGDPLGAQAIKELKTALAPAGSAPQFLMFNLRYDFPSEWSAFANGSANFAASIERVHFPYFVQGAKTLTVESLTLYSDSAHKVVQTIPAVDLATVSAGLSSPGGSAALSLAADASVMKRDSLRQVLAVVQYRVNY